MTRITFDTTPFELSHCRKPRGYGSWAFQVTDIDGATGEAPVEFSPAMTFTDAKKWAKVRITEWLKSEGLTGYMTVDVLS